MPLSLAAERERYAAFAFAVADLLVETDASGSVRFAAGAVRAFAGREAEALLGGPVTDLVGAADRPLIERMVAGAAAGGRAGPALVASPDGRLAARVSAIGLGPKDPVRMTFSGLGPADAGTRRDAATGLLERGSFAALAERRLVEARGGAPAELTLLRLDGLAEADRAATRPGALLGRVAALARLASAGGEAAGLLSPERLAVLHAPGEAAARLESDIQAELRAAGAGSVRTARSTLPLHEAVLTRDDASQALLFALHSFAAEIGAGQPLRSLDEALALRLESTVRQMGEVRQTIARTAFTLAFQPIVRLADRSVQHYEALARFADGRAPAELIPFAENVGLITDLDLAVARMALAHLAELRSAGQSPSIAVNLSARSLESDSFVEALRRLCGGAGRLGRQLMVEITETAGLRDLERANRIVQQLRGDGQKVCLDDFGAGAAAFHYLRALTVDYVKLDGQYTRRLLTNERDASILRTMADLCRKLGVSTVAEMVETEEEAAELARLGADLGQGWLFGRPLPTASVTGPPRPPPVPRLAKRQGVREEWR